MPALGKHFARVTRFVRNLRGGSQPILVEASDEKLYVLKFLDNLQGPMLLFNESMGTELYRACGLSVAPWAPLLVTDEFLDRNPGCWMQTPFGQQRPSSGVCFGSQYLAADHVRHFEVLPGSYFQRVYNPRTFWMAWLLDACCRHADNRQAIFREHFSGSLEAIFIDFGHMFSGPNGDLKPQIRAARYRDERIYPAVSERYLVTLRRIADSLDNDQLWRETAAVPDEWKSPSSIQNFADSLNRLGDRRFVNQVLESITRSRQRHCENSLTIRVAERSMAILRACIPTDRSAHGVLLQ